jgi:hypothetical protein
MAASLDKEIVEAMLSADDPLLRILAEAYSLQAAKSADYNSVIQRDTYWVFGPTSIVQMLWIKVLRMVSLVQKSDHRFESLEDSALDLINYAAFLVEYTRRKP